MGCGDDILQITKTLGHYILYLEHGQHLSARH